MDDAAASSLMLGLRFVMFGAFFFAGYRHAVSFEKKRGRFPGGIPPWAWGLLFGFFLLPSLIAAIIIDRRARKEPIPMNLPPAGPGWASPVQVQPQPPTSGPTSGIGGAAPGATILPGQ